MRVDVASILITAAAAVCGGCVNGARAEPAAEAQGPDAGPLFQLPAIPHGHPRLLWSAERLARARRSAVGTTAEPRADAPADNALRYLLAGDAAAGRAAVKWLLGFTVDTSGVASDDARWFGEDAALVFDWCHDLLTDEQRKAIVDRWNGYLVTLDQKDWGGIGMEGNNYYWGYLRNDVEWSLATSDENPAAPQLLARGLVNRFARSFVPYARGPGRGGVLPEGTQYGPYIPAYATIPLLSMANLGLDLWDTTEFFKQVVFYFVYATTPAATARPDGGAPKFELFPFNDDEKFGAGGSAEKPYIGMFMLAAAERWRAQPVGQYARAWLDAVKPLMSPIARAWAEIPVAARAFSNLPLDDYAAGIGFLYARNRWRPDATVLQLQLGRPTGVGHEHIDWGSFQLWRGGRWLTRETVGYSNEINGWQGGTAASHTKIGADTAIAHNSLLFEGLGPHSVAYRRANPTTLRLESRPNYAYAAVDVGGSYRCTPDRKDNGEDNEYAGPTVREFLFVRPFEALVIFDRMQASGERKPARDVVKTFVLHTEGRPVIDGNRLLAPNGNQALRVWRLLPAAAATRVVVEGGPVGQFRVEVDSKGAPLSYFLHVLQARGARDADLAVTMQEQADEVVVTLARRGQGTARIVFEKGAVSAGGKFGYAPAGAPALHALIEGVQHVDVTSDGPVWR